MSTILKESNMNTNNKKSKTVEKKKMENLLVKMDEMMEDMIDCLYEYEEKIEKNGELFEKSAAEEFEDAKKKIVDLHQNHGQSRTSEDDVVALLKNQLQIAREGQAKVEEENENLKSAMKNPKLVQNLRKENGVLQKDNEELHKLLEEAEKALAETEEMESQLVALKKENKRVRKALKKSFERNSNSPVPPPSPSSSQVQALQKDLERVREENAALTERLETERVECDGLRTFS